MLLETCTGRSHRFPSSKEPHAFLLRETSETIAQQFALLWSCYAFALLRVGLL